MEPKSSSEKVNKNLAIVYIRWSSDPQEKGSTLERQTEIIDAYVARTGLNVVETFIDDGYSASKGEHLSNGNLGKILANAEAGKYRGYALVIEKMNSFSRLGIDETYMLRRRLILAGMEVHLAGSNRVIRTLNDVATSIVNIVEDDMAEKYTTELSINICKGKARAEAKARTTGKAVIGIAPYWLKAVPGQKIEKLTDRCAIVEKIFRLASEGLGCKRIIKRLEADGDKPFGKAAHWNHMYVLDILRNRAVLGEYTPKLTNPETGEPETQETIHDFYPRVIDQLTWDRVQAIAAARNRIDTETRRKNAITGGRVGAEVRNLFTHLVECDGYKMGYECKDGGKPLLVTSYAKGHKSRRIRYDLFETAFLSYLQDLDWKAVSGERDTKELTAARTNLAEIASEIDRSRQQISKWEEIVNNPEAPMDVIISMEKRINAAKPRLDELAEAKERISAEIEVLRAKAGVIVNPEALLEAIRGRDNLEVRALCRQEILKRVRKIDVSFCEAGDMHGSGPKCPMTQARIFFANGVERQIGIWGESWIATHQPFPV
jgi:DNA invertase Pin-like site-specific DNA recombinase